MKGEGSTEAAANRFISGIANIESMRPIREMVRLAREKDSLTAAEFEARKTAYAAEFGDRCPEELKLESPTYRTDPALLDEKIDGYRQDMAKLTAMEESLQPETTAPANDPVTAFLPTYSRLIFSEKEFDKHHRSVNTSEILSDRSELSGIPCSGGRVTGEAFVVEDVQKVGSVKDKILITKMTDPGWVFLLAAAKGVISEKGSLLSHTAIISRELGIPAVVNVDNALSVIRTGDVVSLDGATGEIKILKRAAEPMPAVG